MDTAPEINTCVVCGLANVNVLEVKRSYAAPFGPDVEYTNKIAACPDCGTNIDLSDPDVFPNAVAESESKSIGMILDYIVSKGFTHAAIERALDLPDRAISNWKCKEAVSSSSMALLRILRAFPWVIDVADKNFDPEIIGSANYCIGNYSGLYKNFGVKNEHLDSSWYHPGSMQIPEEYYPQSSPGSLSKIKIQTTPGAPDAIA